MGKTNKEIFENLSFKDQQVIERYLQKIGADLPSWSSPSEEDIGQVAFAIGVIERFDDDCDKAAWAYNKAEQKCDEAKAAVFQRRQQQKDQGEVLGLEDFGGNWDDFRAYLDKRVQEDVDEITQQWNEIFRFYLNVDLDEVPGNRRIPH